MYKIYNTSKEQNEDNSYVTIFKVKRARNRNIDNEDDEEKNIRWLIYENDRVMTDVCMFLEGKGINSDKTSREYAYILKCLFEYLHSKGKKYLQASKRDIYTYINDLAYKEAKKVTHIKTLKRKKTLSQHVSVIAIFYDWLEEIYSYRGFSSPVPKSKREGKSNKNDYSFLYGQLYDVDKEIKETLLPKIKDKPALKHKKWYTSSEIEIISNSFKRRRDRAIFMITVRLGCRISEVLNIKFEDYDSINQCVYISKSKTSPRWLAVPKEVCDEIDTYINTERRDVESEKGLLKYLFINLRRGPHYGKKLSSINYLALLKSYAEKAGFKAESIITHAGRSTRAQELLEEQILNEDKKISDAFILEVMGWSTIDSIKPYKRQDNLRIQKQINERVTLRRRKDKSGDSI